MAELRTCKKCGEEKEMGKFLTYKRKGELKYRHTCCACEKLRQIEYYKNNKDMYRRRQKENKEKIKEYFENWRKDNLEKILEYSRRQRIKRKDWRAQYDRDRKLKNPEYNADRRCRKLNATPDWLTDDHYSRIKEIYLHARDCKIITGEEYHVDHIVPLKGRNVCGLHVPWNLQVLPADVNISKGNKLVVDYPIRTV